MTRQIPPSGWWQVCRRAWAEAKADQVPLLAAGVAFFGFLSLFPAMVAVILAYDEDETRGFVRRKALALALTVGAIGFVVVLGLAAVAPPVLDALALSGPAGIVVGIGRWVVLAVLIGLALAIVYRFAPSRHAPRFRWVSIGAFVATVMWLLASFGFSVYVDTFGNYAKTYGSLAGVVVLLLWLWISVYAVLLGAELNAESEEQTARDTTVGPEQPIGRRGAVKADSLPPRTGHPPGLTRASRTSADEQV